MLATTRAFGSDQFFAFWFPGKVVLYKLRHTQRNMTNSGYVFEEVKELARGLDIQAVFGQVAFDFPGGKFGNDSQVNLSLIAVQRAQSTDFIFLFVRPNETIADVRTMQSDVGQVVGSKHQTQMTDLYVDPSISLEDKEAPLKIYTLSGDSVGVHTLLLNPKKGLLARALSCARLLNTSKPAVPFSEMSFATHQYLQVPAGESAISFKFDGKPGLPEVHTSNGNILSFTQKNKA